MLDFLLTLRFPYDTLLVLSVGGVLGVCVFFVIHSMHLMILTWKMRAQFRALDRVFHSEPVFRELPPGNDQGRDRTFYEDNTRLFESIGFQWIGDYEDTITNPQPPNHPIITRSLFELPWVETEEETPSGTPIERSRPGFTHVGLTAVPEHMRYLMRRSAYTAIELITFFTDGTALMTANTAGVLPYRFTYHIDMFQCGTSTHPLEMVRQHREAVLDMMRIPDRPDTCPKRPWDEVERLQSGDLREIVVPKNIRGTITGDESSGTIKTRSSYFTPRPCGKVPIPIGAYTKERLFAFLRRRYEMIVADRLLHGCTTPEEFECFVARPRNAQTEYLYRLFENERNLFLKKCQADG